MPWRAAVSIPLPFPGPSSCVVLVNRASFPYCPQHRQDLALRGQAGMCRVMRLGERLLVGSLEQIVTSNVERAEESISRAIF